MTLERADVVFAAHELKNFVQHRSNLVRVVRAAGRSAAVYSDPTLCHVDPGCEVRPVRIERFRLSLRHDAALFQALLRALRKDRPEVLHLINLKCILYGGLAARLASLLGWRGRVICTIPGTGRLFAKTDGLSTAGIRRRIVMPALRFAVSGAEVTFESEADRELWRGLRLIPPGGGHVLKGTGVDFTKYKARHRVADASRQLKVLFAGRLIAAKGLRALLAAARRLSEAGAPVEIFVAGAHDGDPDEVPRQEIETTPGVQFLGHIGSIWDVLPDYDVLILPSRYNEGIPRSLMEGQAAGCVAVATIFPGSEAIIEDGRTGRFLHAADEADLTTSIVAVLRELSEDREQVAAIGNAGAVSIRSGGYSDQEIAAQFLRLYGLAAQRKV